MIRLIRKLAVCVAFSAAFLLGAAAPSQAQVTINANGHGAVEAPSGPITFTFSVLEKANGSVVGHAVIFYPATGGRVHVDLTSVMTVGDAVLMAGPITMAVNAPPGYVVGNTAVLAVKDKGNGNGNPFPDEAAGTVGPPDLTIQQIVAQIGPPPPEAYQPLESGNIKIH